MSNFVDDAKTELSGMAKEGMRHPSTKPVLTGAAVGAVAGGLLGAGGMAVAAWARKRNLEARAARKEADAGIEVIKSIEAVPAAKQALKAAIADEANPVDHSPETKAFIAKVTA